MVKHEYIDGNVFITQTTYYIYRSEEDLQNHKSPFLITSNKKAFNKCKENIKNGSLTLDKNYNKNI
jgi:hypothetical protein